MTQTLTEWWTQLDTEARKLAAIYPDVTYPASFTPNKDTDVEGEMTPWMVIYKMASLGASIEAAVASNPVTSLDIKPKLEKVEKKLGEQIPNSSHYIPTINDEKSLLLAIVYYRSQCRFQEVVSPNPTIQNGIQTAILRIPGIHQNKPAAAIETAFLRKQIKNYCSAHPEIAASAEAKFRELFPEENAVGSDLFRPKTLTEQYRDFAGSLVERLTPAPEADSYETVRREILTHITEIKSTLQQTQASLDELYLSKKIQEFTASVREHSQMTFESFAATLNVDGEPTAEQLNKARLLWDSAQGHADAQKPVTHSLTEGANRVIDAVSNSRIVSAIASSRIGAFAGWLIGPITRVATTAAGAGTSALGIDEASRFNAFKEHFNANITAHMEAESTKLSGLSGIKADDLKAASASDIHSLATMNHELNIEIRALKSSLDVYMAQIKNDAIVKFSKAPFFEWFTNQLSQSKWTRSLLYDNLLYLDIAQEFKDKLSALEQNADASLEDLNALKQSMDQQVTEVKRGSMYLLLAEERERAHTHLKELAGTTPVNDEETTEEGAEEARGISAEAGEETPAGHAGEATEVHIQPSQHSEQTEDGEEGETTGPRP